MAVSKFLLPNAVQGIVSSLNAKLADLIGFSIKASDRHSYPSEATFTLLEISPCNCSFSADQFLGAATDLMNWMLGMHQTHIIRTVIYTHLLHITCQKLCRKVPLVESGHTP